MTRAPLMQRAVHALALAFALLGCAAALAVALMVVASIAGRALWAKPIPGDVELTQFGIAWALSLALPWCQMRRANIIVDFFTQGLRERRIRVLDGVGALLLALMCALLAWRTAVGAQAVMEAGETSMILSLPMWWAYVSLVPGLALAAVIATGQGVSLLAGREPGAPAS